MLKKITILALLMMSCCISTPAMSAGQPGTTGTVFNKRFIRKMKPMMPYDQVVKMTGTEGKKVGEDKRSSPSKALYHWDGKRRSALDIKVAAGKVIEVTVVTPRQQQLSLGKNGELVEAGN